MTKITYIPGEIANAAIDEHGNRKPVTRTQHIFDDAKGKSQAEVNKDIDNTLALHQSEINALDSQNYVTVDTFGELPATGAADTVYRVANYDGTQVVTNKYAEYAWNGTQYKLLDVKEYGIDDEPTAGSRNLVESGGVYEENLQNGIAYFANGAMPSFLESWTDNVKTVIVTLPDAIFRIYNSKGYRKNLTNIAGTYTVTNQKILVYNRIDEIAEVIDFGGTNTDKYYILLGISTQAVYGLLAPHYWAWKDKSEYIAYIPNTYSLNGEYDGTTCKVYAQDVNCSIRLYNKSSALAILLNNDYTINTGRALVVDLADSNTIKIIQFTNVNIFDNTIVLISNLRGALGGLLAGFIYDIEIRKRLDAEKAINFYPNNILLSAYSGGLSPSSVTVGDTITISSYASTGYMHYVMKCEAGTQLNVDITSPSASRPALFITDLNSKLTYCSGETIKDVITVAEDSVVYINTTSPTSRSYRKNQYFYSNRFYEDYNLFEISNPYGLSISNTTVGNPSKCMGTYDNSTHSYKSVGTIVYPGEIIHVSGNSQASSGDRPALSLIDRKTFNLLYTHAGGTIVLTYIVNKECYLIVNDSKINTEGYTNPFLSISGVDKAEAMNRRRVIIESGNPLYLGSNDDYKIKDYIDNNLRSRIVSMFGTRHAPASANVAMIHFSDLHGNADGIAALLEFKNMYYEEINEIINTGDTVTSLYDDGSWDAVAAVEGYSGILNTIGNHDGALDVGATVADWEAVPKTDVYNRYIKPYISNWNVIQPDNAETNGLCYYYKDYSAPNSIYSSTPTADGAIAGIRFIVLDCIQTDLTVQTTWLASVLDDAKTNKLAVVIAQHCRPTGTMQKINGFNTGFTPDSFYNNPPAVEAVDTFIENGGMFVCWIGGHTHFDSTQIITDHHNQLSILVSTDGGTGRLCDYKKETHHESINLFNLISFNTEAKLIKVLRIGAHISEKMQDNRSYSVNWKTKEVWR